MLVQTGKLEINSLKRHCVLFIFMHFKLKWVKCPGKATEFLNKGHSPCLLALSESDLIFILQAITKHVCFNSGGVLIWSESGT